MSKSLAQLTDEAKRGICPFLPGDKVRFVHSTANWSGMLPGDVVIVKSLRSAETTANKYQTDIYLKGHVSSMLWTRFELVERPVPDDTTGAAAEGDINDFISKKADELGDAIEAGTMTGYYSALGFIVEFMNDLAKVVEK